MVPSGLYLPHGRKYGPAALMRRQPPQSISRRKLQIDAHAICQETGLLDELLRCSRNRLHMDIALKMIDRPQPVKCLVKKLHRKSRTLENTRAQKQTFNIVSAVEFHRQPTDLVRRKSCPRYIIGTAIDTVMAVKYTLIGKQDLQKRNTSPVRSKAVADP